LVRVAATKALARIGTPAQPAVPALLRSLKDRSAAVRSCAAGALGWVGPGAEAVPPLIEALSDEDAEVRRCAAFALSQLGPLAEAAVPGLIERLPDPRMGYM